MCVVPFLVLITKQLLIRRLYEQDDRKRCDMHQRLPPTPKHSLREAFPLEKILYSPFHHPPIQDLFHHVFFLLLLLLCHIIGLLVLLNCGHFVLCWVRNRSNEHRQSPRPKTPTLSTAAEACNRKLCLQVLTFSLRRSHLCRTPVTFSQMDGKINLRSAVSSVLQTFTVPNVTLFTPGLLTHTFAAQGQVIQSNLCWKNNVKYMKPSVTVGPSLGGSVVRLILIR